MNIYTSGFRKEDIIKLLNDIKKRIKRVEENVPIQIDNAINQLLDGAPEALDTLKELADALGNNPDILTELNDKINSDCEQIRNKVTSLSSLSTDEEYPSAKCVYDIIGDIESALDALL